VESGFGAGTPDDVAETVRLVLDAGAVGINLEDSAPRPTRVLLPPEAQVERLVTAPVTAALAGVDLFINARIDTYLVADGRDGGDAARLEETVRRGRIYAGAGADGAFVPGVTDAPTIRRLATALAEVGLPLNVMAGPGAPSVSELRALGVARVSVGPAITQAVMTHVQRAAAEVLRDGTYDLLRDGMPFPEADALFAPAGACGPAPSGTYHEAEATEAGSVRAGPAPGAAIIAAPRPGVACIALPRAEPERRSGR
jgi:2-methylisocitrate lyase-like PEP mutase family enzyme